MTALLALAALASGCLTPRAIQEGEAARKLGLAYLSEGNVAEAVSQLKGATDLNRWDADSWHGYGMALFAAESHERAETALLKALELRADYSRAHMNLGSLYLELERWDEAAEHLQIAAKDPEYRQVARARHNLAWALFNQGKYPEAREELHGVLKAFPLFCPSLHHLGRVDEAEGKLQDALTRHRQAVECDPRDLRSRLSLGIIETRLDLVSDACEHLSTVRDADEFGELRGEAVSYLEMLECDTVSER